MTNGKRDKLVAQPLSNHQLYEGNDVDDARDVLSRLFTEIALEPLDPSRPFRAQVNGVELPRIAICYLRFENGAVAGPVQPLDFHTLQLNLTGSSVYNTNERASGGDARHGVMLSAGQTVRNRHSAGNGHLALVVKDEVVRNHLARYTGRRKNQPLKFAAEFDLTQPRVASLLVLIDTFTTELDRPGGILEAPAAVANFEDLLLTSLIFGFEHNQRDLLERRTPASAPSQVQDLEDYIAAHAAEPISMANLTEAVGLSGATIYRAFKKHRGCTPIQFLRNERMRLVREHLLLRGPMETVEEIARRFGFVHMGRFAAEYYRRYQEYPSETRMRSKNGKPST